VPADETAWGGWRPGPEDFDVSLRPFPDDESAPVECPSCVHTDLDHDETGCTVPGCECTGP
jgi:hypothetical protein